MNTVAIIQARMGSTRLPGKILKKVLDKPLLGYLIQRLLQCKMIDKIVVATTTNDQEEPIINICKKLNVDVYRGSEFDVLSRYYDTANFYNAQHIVRITSDCPIIDPNVIDSVINVYKDNNVDYASNSLQRTYPKGMDVEIFSYRSLKEAYLHGKKDYEREHVTPYIYGNLNKFTLLNVSYKKDESSHRWTVDTEDDFFLIEKIIEELYPTNPMFNLEDTLLLLEKFPEWKKINNHVEQKKLGE